MNVPKALHDLENRLKASGFTEGRRERWGAGRGVRQFIGYERNGVSIGIGYDADWEIVLGPMTGDSRDNYSAAAWALWVGKPLHNPDSWEEQAHFVADNLDLLQTQMASFDRRRMDALLRNRKTGAP